MNIFERKYTSFLKSLIILWIVLAAAELLGFNFEVDLTFLFLVFLLFTLPFIFCFIKKNKETLSFIFNSGANFLLKIFKNSFADRKTPVEVILYIPRFLFLCFRSFFEKIIFTKFFLLLIFTALSVIDIFLTTENSVLLLATLLAFWLIASFLYKFSSKHSLLLGMTFLLTCPFLAAANQLVMLEKSAQAAILFLFLGTSASTIAIIRRRDHRG